MNEDFIYSVQRLIYTITPFILLCIGIYANISDDWIRMTILLLGVGTALVQYLTFGLDSLISKWIVAYHFFKNAKEHIVKEVSKK